MRAIFLAFGLGRIGQKKSLLVFGMSTLFGSGDAGLGFEERDANGPE